ncbi:MAG: hypothetical protein HY815_16000 [Candidatus Riflebacteria bacterium]|nr:hypothetical protein [Candidatus Riflebacteria bacterium]
MPDRIYGKGREMYRWVDSVRLLGLVAVASLALAGLCCIALAGVGGAERPAPPTRERIPKELPGPGIADLFSTPSAPSSPTAPSPGPSAQSAPPVPAPTSTPTPEISPRPIAAINPDRYRLTGVFGHEGEQAAVLLDAATGKEKILYAGQEVDGECLVEISEDRAVLEVEGQRLTLPLASATASTTGSGPATLR